MSNLGFSINVRANASPAFAVSACKMTLASSYSLSSSFLLKSTRKFLSKLIISWKEFTHERYWKRKKLYGRINAFDLKSVKAMVRKDGCPETLIKYALAFMFEFRGKIFKLSRVWKKGMNAYMWVYIPLMPTDEWTASDLPRNYDDYRLESNAIDNVSRFPVSNSTLKYRIESKEEKTLKMLRFLLKKGCNPNDKYFLANLIFKHKYHSRTFLLKIIGMCSHYGLEASTMYKALKMDWSRNFEMDYYIGPILDIHKEKVNIKDNISLCCSWASKKSLLKATRSSLGNLSKLNDDVIGVIDSFVYPFPY